MEQRLYERLLLRALLEKEEAEEMEWLGEGEGLGVNGETGFCTGVTGFVGEVERVSERSPTPR